MGVMLKVKKKPVPEKQLVVGPALSEFAEVIDSLGAQQIAAATLAAKIKELQAELEPYTEQLKKLKEMVTARAVEKGIDPDQALTELGEQYQAVFGPQQKDREIYDIENLFSHMGDEVFFKVAKVTMKDIDAYLTPIEQQDCVKTVRGIRSIKIQPKPKPLV